MRRSLYLYTVNSSILSTDFVNSCIKLLAPNDSFYVSRTLGPGNYFEINKRIIKVKSADFPKKDITREIFESGTEIGSLLRKNSVLQVQFRLKDNVTLSDLYSHIESPLIRGMGFSIVRFSFGPTDLVKFIENSKGDDDVKLEAVSSFSFCIDWDNYRGDFYGAVDRLSSSEFFINLKERLETVTGPLTLFTSE